VTDLGSTIDREDEEDELGNSFNHRGLNLPRSSVILHRVSAER
jgi:hypothetical protein